MINTVSNVFCRSRNAPHVISPLALALSIAFLNFSVIVISAWFVEWRLQKPN